MLRPAQVTSLLDHAVMLASEGLPELVPFALVQAATLHHATIVTERSDTAMHLGRKMVRRHRADASAYVIAIDTYIRVDGERTDAVMFEHGTRDADVAELFAWPYRDRAWSGDRIPMGPRPSLLVDIDPVEFPWGDAITPDLVSADRTVAVHCISHDLSTDAAVARTIRFVRARIRSHARALPSDMRQLVSVDDRGPLVPSGRARLRAAFADLELASEKH